MARLSPTVWGLKALGYPGSACLERCTCDELPCPLLTWLVTELRATCLEMQDGDRRDSRVNTVLVGELRDVLTKLHCPYASLTTETLSSVLLNNLIEFLVTELLAVRILQFKDTHPEEQKQDENEKDQREERGKNLDLEEGDQEAEGGKKNERECDEFEYEFSELIKVLGLAASSQLSDVYAQVESHLAMLPDDVLPGPLLKTPLSPEQWSNIQKISQVLIGDYECRMQMVIKRFEVTRQSFTWGERGQERLAAVSSLPLPAPPSGRSCISLSSLLAAREDQSFILPVKAGHSTAIHKVLMGTVPDRGGRPGEIEPPMPIWEGRREGGGRGGHQRRWTKRKKKK
ncbi:protein FAM98A [Paramormyrops kingsleyae]|uniref:protein FAM98A n=1 Tax=Paramormyrops kingsleyae TaxID=1676925 RepID=UPI003B974141